MISYTYVDGSTVVVHVSTSERVALGPQQVQEMLYKLHVAAYQTMFDDLLYCHFDFEHNEHEHVLDEQHERRLEKNRKGSDTPRYPVGFI